MAIKDEIAGELIKGVDPELVFFNEGQLGETKEVLADWMLKAGLDPCPEPICYYSLMDTPTFHGSLA